MYPQGGYKTQTVTQLGNLLAAFNTWPDFIPSVATLLRRIGGGSGTRGSGAKSKASALESQSPSFNIELRLGRLADAPADSARKELRGLERAGLLLFSESCDYVHQVRIAGWADLIDALGVAGVLRRGRSHCRDRRSGSSLAAHE